MSFGKSGSSQNSTSDASSFNQSTADSFNQALNSSFSNSGQDVWNPQYQTQGYDMASNLLGQNLGQGAADARLQRSTEGNPLLGQSQGAVSGILQGLLQPGGDYFKNQIKSIYNDIRPGIDSQFAGGGRYGSGLAQIGMEDRMMDAGSNLYTNSLNSMLQAAGMAPDLANADYNDINQMQQAQNSPWDQLAQYFGLIGGPTVLSSGQSGSLGTSLGGSTSQSTGASQATSTGRGGSSGFNFGIPL